MPEDLPLAGRRRVRAAWARLRPEFERRTHAMLDRHDGAALLARVDRYFSDFFEPLEILYAAEHDVEALTRELLGIVLARSAERRPELRDLDHRREIGPDWFQHEEMVGYVCYVDRFSGTLEALVERLGYLEELGVTYLHLMPLLRPRPEPNDGGYAVEDYRSVDPRLGNLRDLDRLAEELRLRGISLCIDLVVNHTAREHEWARRALAGDRAYQDFYLLFPDRSAPDAYERTLPEVFPDTAPGSFTWVDELDAWVWTTFHDYQWDLNYANPRVLAEMLDVMLFLGNVGVEVLRLDAVPFMWKRLGTDCQNQPEVHELLQVFRGLLRVGAPALVFKAEAIVTPGHLVRYLGTHHRQRPECDLAYHNQLMVMLWSSIASRDARLATTALQRMRRPASTTAWCTYVRCHDDIGWAVTDEDASAVGLDAFDHRRFLASFYAGRFPGSFSRGDVFQENPQTGDARTSGTAASLCGLQQALELGDDGLLDQALRRLMLLYAVILAWGGVPLLYMGDELALRNDPGYLADPALAEDNRWMHRPVMDWRAAGRRHDPEALEGRVWAAFRHLIEVRTRLPVLHAAGAVLPWWTDNPRVFAWHRDHPRYGSFLGLANLGDGPESIDAGLAGHAGLPYPVDALADGAAPDVHAGRLRLPGLGVSWLVARG